VQPWHCWRKKGLPILLAAGWVIALTRTNRKVDYRYSSSLPCQRWLLLKSVIEYFSASASFFGLQLGNVCFFLLNCGYVHGVECISRNWRLLSWSRNLASSVECRVSWRCSRRPNHWIRCWFSCNHSQPIGYLMSYQVWLPEILHCARRVFFCVCYEFYNKQWFFPPCSVNWLVFIMKTEYVYCAVGTKSFDIMQVKFLLQCLKCMFPFTLGLPVGFWFRITVFFPCVLHIPTIAPSLIWNCVISTHILKALVYIFLSSYAFPA